MKTYRSHKIVQAAKISGATRLGDGRWHIDLDDQPCAMTLAPGITARYEPQAGDYIVQYEDGYLSLSPAKAFEDGYTEVTNALMTFSQALEQVKLGAKVARTGWNGKGMFIALQVGSTIPASAARGGAAKVLADMGVEQINILPHIDMRSAQGDVVVGWLASQTDMLADDWAIVL